MKKYSIFSSIGVGTTKLNSFDDALLGSKVANYNLVKISSILPAGSEKSNFVNLEEGKVLHTAYASITSKEKNVVCSAAIGVAIPVDFTKIGVIMEFSDFCAKGIAEETVRTMLTEAMFKRNYKIKEIQIASSEIISDGLNFATAFAGICIWNENKNL